ncbi:hypothetical protein MPSEU_000829400 [Mayamaea pseudoterrestris]|nr:hypothetical protein MPSEU_000829400 [Mayamaea pseudoterrestris]
MKDDDPMDLDMTTRPAASSTSTFTPPSLSLPTKHDETSNETPPFVQPHAFHYNLPDHHKDPETGIPYITTYCEIKAKELYQLAMSIQLTPEMLYISSANEESEQQGNRFDQEAIDSAMDDDDDDDEYGDAGLPDAPSSATSSSSSSSTSRTCKLSTLGKQCARLQAQWTGLEQLKYSGFSQTQLSNVLLHLLNLVMASYDAETRELHFESVGQVVIVNGNDGSYTLGKDEESEQQATTDDAAEQTYTAQKEALDCELERPFALPTPTREVLLSIIINILSNKGPLRAVSNAALYVPGKGDGDDIERIRLVLHWKSFLRALLRTAPYLDEHKQSASPSDSHTRQSNIVKRTSQMIRDARHFFDQRNDATANEVWNMVRTDCMYHSHTHACYRGSIMLYLFQPSRCSSAYYEKVLPEWLECWTNIERCPEYDFLWLTLLCRARKHVSSSKYDWGPIRRRLLTHAQYWLQLPIGGTAMDKSFPRAPNPRSRACPSRLKAFAGSNSSYEEGIDFIAKVVKLLVSGLGSGLKHKAEGSTAPCVSEGTGDVLRFLSFVTPYFNPSNIGPWTFTLGAFLHYFAFELCCRCGEAAGLEALRATHPELASEFVMNLSGASGADVPANEIVILLDALLPLCQQAIYSKNAHVGRAGEAAMLYLVQIDPVRSTPAFLDFAMSALDTSAINMSHQAPAALSALTGLIQPSLRSDPVILLSRLPDILRMSLAGIDSNDQHKCIRTLILYRSLSSWIPIGGNSKSWNVLDLDIGDTNRLDGTRSIAEHLIGYFSSTRNSPDYINAVESLPHTSLLRQGVHVASYDDICGKEEDLLREASAAMGDWSLAFLERVFGLLRASGEREKRAKSSSGIASRHSSADVHQSRNFSRVLTECLMQLFAAMDNEIHDVAVRAVERFIQEETLLSAEKDVAIVCQAAAAARFVRDGLVDSPGLDILIGTLAGECSHISTKTMIYRLRCLAGAVKSAGSGLLKHRHLISKAIEFALASNDRHLLKTGCKLLRHTLATLSESYPISSDYRPRLYKDKSKRLILGRSAQLHRDEVIWHVPDISCVEFFAELLSSHVICPLDELCNAAEEFGISGRSVMLSTTDVIGLRRCLRIIRYVVRGGSGLLLDCELEGANHSDVVPYEKSSSRLLDIASTESISALRGIRGRLCSTLIVLSSIIASDTLYPDAAATLPADDPYRKTLPLIASDPKICKECCDISLLLLTRRGAAFRSQEGRTIWKAQKQLATDFTLCAAVDRLVEVLQMGNQYGNSSSILFKDGEDAGKTISRRLLVTRIQLFHDLLQRNASFQIPRRLRRYERDQNRNRNILFSVDHALSDMIATREIMLQTVSCRPLDLYEGVIDGLFALCCHSNTHIRASAISVIDYALTRFGWILGPRVPRLLSGLALQDNDLHGKFGVPSCLQLSNELNQQGKRKRLAEAIKGVCAILALPRSVRLLLGSWTLRLKFVQTLCYTDELMTLLPAEELQKVVHYLQAIFSPFRSSIYVLPATTLLDEGDRIKCITFLIGMLSVSDKLATELNDSEESDSADSGKAHWKMLLFAGWFLLNFTDKEDIQKDSPVCAALWSTCFSLIENNNGQPLQRVALGMLGKLILLPQQAQNHESLIQRLSNDSFCKVFGQALVYDHKEDTSFGGGHKSEWSNGVENIIRDASRHLAPKSLFPFQRTSQSLGSFKIAHSQLIERALSSIDNVQVLDDITRKLLLFSEELASAPPSEDQRNQQVTAAEIFAGVSSTYIRSSRDLEAVWGETLLPHLENAITRVPFSLCGAYFDALRFSLQYARATSFMHLNSWLADKVKSTLWQSKASGSHVVDTVTDTNGHNSGTDGFTAQSKWLHLMSAVIIEMDECSVRNRCTSWRWYESALLPVAPLTLASNSSKSLNLGWAELWNIINDNLLPFLTGALGHPFDSCRDHIARTLFWICYSYRRLVRSAVRGISHEAPLIHKMKDPSSMILHKIMSLRNVDSWEFSERCHALNTVRRFISYCVHLGESKFEYSEYVVPLLPLVFEALDSASEDEISNGILHDQDENTTRRALEAEVVKAYRYMISDISITAVVSYGRDEDMVQLLDATEFACKHEKWQVRLGGANFLRCFQFAHKFLLRPEDAEKATTIAVSLLADERREVSSAGMSALVGILAASPTTNVARKVDSYAKLANRTRLKKPKKDATVSFVTEKDFLQEKKRSHDQQVSVFFLVSSIMSQPYETPSYVPQALEAISKHSFERSAPLGVRDTVKKCCAEYKRTHMSDSWDVHRSMFTQEQLEAFEDVTSTPHYYA